MSKWKSHPGWTGATAGAIAFAVPASVRPGSLAEGGLAPLVVAATVAGVVGWPGAVALWRSDTGPPRRLTPWAASIGQLLLPLTLSAIWVSVLPGLLGLMAAALLWAGLGLGLPSRAAHVCAVVGGLCLVQGPAAAGINSLEAVPWTLLEPVWSQGPTWLGSSLVSGLMLAGLGFGQWERARPSPPGTQSVPLIPVCTAILVAVSLSVAVSARHEAERALATDSMTVLVVFGCLLTAISSAISLGDRWTVVAGVAAHSWFLWAGPDVATWWLAAWLPLGMSLVLFEAGLRRKYGARWTLWAASAIAVAALGVGLPELPTDMVSAIAVSITGVALLWTVGARVALERA